MNAKVYCEALYTDAKANISEVRGVDALGRIRRSTCSADAFRFDAVIGPRAFMNTASCGISTACRRQFQPLCSVQLTS